MRAAIPDMTTPSRASESPRMLPSPRTAACLFMALACGVAPADSAKLSKEEIESAVKIDAVTIPTPGELLAAIDKVGKPNWQAQYRAPIPTAFQSRPQIALNLGGLIADGY